MNGLDQRPGRHERRARRPHPWLLVAIAVAATLGAAGTVALALSGEERGGEPGIQVGLLIWIILPYVFSGLIAWYRRPDSRLGPLMILGGAITLLSCLSFVDSSLPLTLGIVFDLVPFTIFLHVFLAFPSGRLRSDFERALVATSYAVTIGLQLVELMLGGFYEDNVLAIVAAPGLAADLGQFQQVAQALLSIVALFTLLSRRRRASRPMRRPVRWLVASFTVALVLSAAVLLVSAFSIDFQLFLQMQRALLLVVGFAPFVFLYGLLDARLARAAVGDLLVELRADPPPEDLSEPLARALQDPSVRLAYWLPEYGRWASADGGAVDLPASDDPDTSITVIDRDDVHVAALIHDSALDDEAELLEAVSAAAAIALENGRLHAELQAKLIELEGSRGRVVAAGQQERKRLERNLHDGAQQRLIALSLELGMLADKLAGDPDAKARIEGARDEIAVSLEELRDVARGLHPAVLSGHGLAVALESLAATCTVPVELDVELDERLDESVEVAAYYVVNESLANVGKHARAGSARIEVSRSNGTLVVEVRDDGIGGADAGMGSGLRGLSDRVEAVGGRLRISTPDGGGTTVRAEMPCG